MANHAQGLGVYTARLSLEPFAPTQTNKLFDIKGSTTVGTKLAPSLAAAYLKEKGLNKVTINSTNRLENTFKIQGYDNQDKLFYIEVSSQGSSTGFTALDDKSADIAMASRPIKDSEYDKLSSLGDMRNERAEHIIAIDGLALIVNSTNPVSKLSIDQVAAIFSGEIANWQQLGGPQAAIKLYARDDASGTWDTFKSLVLGKKTKLAETADRLESNSHVSKRIVNDPTGIGFVGLDYIENNKALAVGSSLASAVIPDVLQVATEDYALSRRLFFYTNPRQDDNSLVSEFIRFVQHEKGQTIVEKIGFVSQKPNLLNFQIADNLPEEYINITKNAKRLSINIRFKHGLSTLDNKAQQDIRRVVQFMDKTDNRDKQLLVIGFSDERADEQRSKLLSRLRAMKVKSALRKKQVTVGPVSGFGASKPVADYKSIVGRAKNRRVELWLIDR